tara:strand:+ start:2115 stop:2438 length:324 start_codon:yes stop_codon:yes gene_type:complete
MFRFFIILIFIFNMSLGQSNQKKFNWTLNLIPTVGQINNEKYIKAIVLGAAQSYSINRYIHFNKTNQIGKRNTHAWWILGLYFYGIIDAYVDHSLKNFPNPKEGMVK